MTEEAVLVLVVEDDTAIQGLVAEGLSDGGFELVIAQTGEEALRLFREDRSPYRALVTDINLGTGINGWEVASQIREISPDLPIVYMTGDSVEAWNSKSVPESILLQKPFAPAQMVTAVSQLLNLGSSSA
jgi:CheY-like chemotaxis protein